MLKRFLEFRFVKTVNVIYSYQNVHSTRETKYEDGEIVFVERCFSMDLPQTGNALIRNGYHFRVATIWHNKDENCIEVDLNDL